MKLNSKLFDAIRIKPRRHEEPDAAAPRCAWENCAEKGLYKAPKGNRAEGEYHHFCLVHVRHYNTAFNFFSGMKPEEMESHVHQSAQTDGRPTWGLGAKPNQPGPRMPKGKIRDPNVKNFADPLHIFARYARASARGPAREREIKLHEPDRRAFETLGFQGHAKTAEIKSAYKALVKIHHPDANGGDRASEDRLRAIIAAYTHLKSKGFVTR